MQTLERGTHDRADCVYCMHAKEYGWWGDGDITHCRDCGRTWNMQTEQAHCTTCCRHFSASYLFDRHITEAGHRDPRLVGYEVVQTEDGTWTTRDPRTWPK